VSVGAARDSSGDPAVRLALPQSHAQSWPDCTPPPSHFVRVLRYLTLQLYSMSRARYHLECPLAVPQPMDTALKQVPLGVCTMTAI